MLRIGQNDARLKAGESFDLAFCIFCCLEDSGGSGGLRGGRRLYGVAATRKSVCFCFPAFSNLNQNSAENQF